MAFKDFLGDRMKHFECIETDRRLDPRFLPVYARLDGRGFSKFTSGLRRPFDARMSRAMIETAKYLVAETGAKIGYTQSDEISLLWSITGENPETRMIFDGKMQKVVSILASMATAKFTYEVASNEDPEFAAYAKKLPHFDTRLFTLPSREEAANAFLWRCLDAERNAISMAAHANFSHTRLQGVSQTGMLDMLHDHGIVFSDFPAFFRQGTFVRRQTIRRVLSEAERQEIPEACRPEAGQSVVRSEVREIQMPRFRSVTNRVQVLYDGVDPLTENPWTPRSAV